MFELTKCDLEHIMQTLLKKLEMYASSIPTVHGYLL